MIVGGDNDTSVAGMPARPAEYPGMVKAQCKRSAAACLLKALAGVLKKNTAFSKTTRGGDV